MGGARPKIFLKIGELTVIERSLKAIFDSRVVSSCVIPTRSDCIPEIQALVRAFPACHVIAGGETRQESVALSLEWIRSTNKNPDACIVLVHDAARCLVSPELVQRSVQACARHQAVTAAMPMVDSLLEAEPDGKVTGYLDRSKVFAVQTPQVFSFPLLWQAHQKAKSRADESGLPVTDDAGLVREIHPVYVVEGERRNFKLTVPEDVEMARALLDQSRKR